MIAFVEARTSADKEDDPVEGRPSKLILYEPETGKKESILLESLPEVIRTHSWSLSKEFLLLFSGSMFYCLSLDTRQFREFAPFVDNWWSVQWITDDRLLWTLENKLIVTEYDGSNPREILRAEHGRFYFDGEGKT